MKALASEVAELFRNALHLHVKMRREKRSSSRLSSSIRYPAEASTSEADDEVDEPPELTELTPCQLSYWIGHVFQVRVQGLTLVKTPESLTTWCGQLL